MRSNPIEPQKLIGELPCPGCGDSAPSAKWKKDGYRYESITCVKCSQEWGRILDRGTGSWHVLWPLGPDGLKISRRPREVSDAKQE
jgi:hypothetical protein